jgi:hypothetical protein
MDKNLASLTQIVQNVLMQKIILTKKRYFRPKLVKIAENHNIDHLPL